jgi:hypothetical protein
MQHFVLAYVMNHYVDMSDKNMERKKQTFPVQMTICTSLHIHIVILASGTLIKVIGHDPNMA